MLATLRGEVTQVEDNAIIVETGGLGLRVFVPVFFKTKIQTGEGVLLYTHLVVREDEWKLFGFETQAERELFTLLLGVDGVGPRTALAVMSGSSLEMIHQAVISEDPDLLGRVPGVGKKTAQKIVLYLHDKLKPGESLMTMVAISEVDSEVLAALTTLGYSVVEAQSAIQSIPKGTANDVEERLRLALKQFSP